MKRPGIRALEAHKSQFTAFVPYGGNPGTEHTVEQLAGSGLVEKIYLLTPGTGPVPFKGCIPLRVQSLNAGSTMKKIAAKTTADAGSVYVRIPAWSVRTCRSAPRCCGR